MTSGPSIWLLSLVQSREDEDRGIKLESPTIRGLEAHIFELSICHQFEGPNPLSILDVIIGQEQQRPRSVL